MKDSQNKQKADYKKKSKEGLENWKKSKFNFFLSIFFLRFKIESKFI